MALSISSEFSRGFKMSCVGLCCSTICFPERGKTDFPASNAPVCGSSSLLAEQWAGC